MSVRIVVDGAPVGKGRPRFVRKRGIAFTPAKTANYEAILAAAGAEAMAGRAPLEGPLVVHLTAFMPIAKSWSRKKISQALEGIERPGRPDLDNILKVMDALNQIVWRDDAQIAEARLSKLYDLDPRLEIEVEHLADGLTVIPDIFRAQDLRIVVNNYVPPNTVVIHASTEECLRVWRENQMTAEILQGDALT